MSALVIGYGNPGRLDDGLGPALAEALEAAAVPDLAVDVAYQLSVEHAELVARHDLVVFADAAVSGPEPFDLQTVEPGSRRTVDFSSHHLDPATVLGLARDLFGSRATGLSLAIRGYEFDEFGERLSAGAAANLEAALAFLIPALRDGRLAGGDAGRAGPSLHGGITMTDTAGTDRGRTILVVDDDQDVRDSLALVLRSHGYRVVEAPSAEEALRRFREAAPDLVIADLMMEEVDSGTGLVKDLRALGATTPIYLLSSVGDAMYGQIEYGQLGLAGVFQKPVDPATLLATLEARLR